MTKYLFILLTLIVGGFIPVQAVVNSRLGKQTGGPLMGALMSFFVGFIILLAINLLVNANNLLQLKPVATGPWYLWMGGLIGAVFVSYITFINQKQGVGLTFALVISGQIFTSLIIDHFGLFGSQPRPLNSEKYIGAALIIAGIIFIKK